MGESSIIPAKVVDELLCRTCLSEDSIELYDSTNKPMNYNLMRKFNNYTTFDKHVPHMSHFKCKCCGKKYSILWENGIPIPLQSDTRVNNFIYNFTKEE